MKITFITSDCYLDTAVPLINSLLPYADITLVVNCLYTRAGNLFSSTKFISPNAAITEISNEQTGELKGYMSLLDKTASNLKIAVIFYKNFSTASLHNWLHTSKVIKYIGETDIIHMQQPSAQYFFLLNKFSYNKLVADIHDFMQHSGLRLSPWSQLIVNQWLRRSRAIITHNSFEYNLMKETAMFSRKKIYMLPFGPVHLTTQSCNYEASPPPTVLFFGRICPYKGIEYLVEAVPIIKKEIPELKVIIAGSGEYYFDIRAIKNDETYEIINHYLSNEQLAKIINKSTLVVCPYTDSTQSGVIMTAFAYGKPVVATNVGGIPEVVEDGLTGYVVPPRDPVQLAKAIIGLLTNEMLRKNMSANINKKFGGQSQTWGNIAKKTMDIYKSITDKT